jgi:hypothetical protein
VEVTKKKKRSAILEAMSYFGPGTHQAEESESNSNSNDQHTNKQKQKQTNTMNAALLQSWNPPG